MLVVMWLLLFCLGVVVNGRMIPKLDDPPPDCEWKPSEDDEDGVLLSCRLRTIGSAEKTFGNLTSTQTELVTSLLLVCSDVLFFESSLESNSGGFLSQLRHLRSITIEYCKIRYIPSSVLAGLPDLRYLTIKTHNTDWSAMSMEFHSESFHGLSELRSLNISDNNIWTFPTHVFCELQGLTALNLSRNRIHEIFKLGFSDWGNGPSAPGRTCNVGLESLDLSRNEISQMPDNGLTSLRSLQRLMLQENKLSALADRAFVGLVSLQVLNASSNRLTALPPELFQSTRDIKEIHLQNNSINVLAPGLLEGLDQLLVLDLSGNQLTSNWVNRDTFSGLVRLVVLNLSHNMISRIDSHVFQDLYSLQILSLEYNNIEIIAEGSFSTLSNLHGLILSHNKLTRIETYHFSGLYVLNQLFLDNNRITEIHPRSFENCTNLQDLGLSGNSLQSVPNGLGSLLYLKTLDLAENRIKAITNSSFQGLEQLYGLRLIDNEIENITRDTFSTLPSLQVLNLACNKIKHVDQNAFRTNPTLHAVRLDGNKLTDINGVFSNMNSLFWLNISDNQLTYFDYSFLPKSLDWLDMHKNNITELGNYYYDRRTSMQIKMLDVSFNKIKEIGEMSIPDSVETVFLNDNEIQTIRPNTFLLKTNLTRVVLYGNKLQKLDLAALVLQPVPEGKELPQFYIGGNPFFCDCTMEWLQRINQLSHVRQHPRVMDLDTVMCKLTHSRSGIDRPLLELQPSEFLCPYEAHCFALCHCCEFDACDCEMTCPQNCTCYHDTLWASNVVDCSNSGYTSVPPKIPMDATEIYLDGNDFGDLGSHVFIGKKKLQVLYLNNSNIQTIHNRTFNGLTSLRVLHMESNKIQELRGFEFEQMENLRELYLNHNEISAVGNKTFAGMKTLEVLRVDNNKIADFSPWQLPSSGKIARVIVDGNSWACDCESVAKLQAWMRDNTAAAGLSLNNLRCMDKESSVRETLSEVILRCSRNAALSNVGETTLATSVLQSDSIYKTVIFHGEYLPLLVATLVTVIAISFLIVLCFVFRNDLSLWIHSKYGIRIFKNSSSVAETLEERDRLYDAYLVYSIKDEDFVNRVVACELEQEGHSLCLHYRELVSDSSFLADSVLSAVEASRRIVFVFSLSFLQHEWDLLEFRSSLQASLHQTPLHLRRRKIIFLLTTDLENLNLDPELQELLRTCTVISWGEKRFWEKLRYAMPDTACRKKRKNNNTKKAMNGSGKKNTVSRNNMDNITGNGKIVSARYTAAPTNLDPWCKYAGGGHIHQMQQIAVTPPQSSCVSERSSQRTEEEEDSGSQHYDYTQTGSHSYVSIESRLPNYSTAPRHVYSTIPDPMNITQPVTVTPAPGRTYFV
ncbi:hypothetical protein RUM44_013161 [Polyplax serrata]|uniref:TIR domain-containing protein n=1 Tax=Polyplax serrata TaxID=468196 RepID=A0ABR1BHQ1_POLSC